MVEGGLRSFIERMYMEVNDAGEEKARTAEGYNQRQANKQTLAMEHLFCVRSGRD